MADLTGLAVHARLLGARCRAQAQYRLSFALDTAGNSVWAVLDIVTVLVFFHVTPALGGFPLRPAFLMASLATCGVALADLVAGNVDLLRSNVRSGRLDILLVRPLGLLAQLISMDFALRRVGRAAQGFVMYGIGLSIAQLAWSPARVAFAVVAPLAAGVFFGAVFVAGGTVAFWWIDSAEFANSFTAGGGEFSKFPLTVYGGLLRRLFGYGLGFAFVAYYPTLALLGRRDPMGAPNWLGWWSPLAAALAALVAAAIWRVGVRHYRSTGS